MLHVKDAADATRRMVGAQVLQSSHGELLCVGVLQDLGNSFPPHDTARALIVVVYTHALELDDEKGGKPLSG